MWSCLKWSCLKWSCSTWTNCWKRNWSYCYSTTNCWALDLRKLQGWPLWRPNNISFGLFSLGHLGTFVWNYRFYGDTFISRAAVSLKWAELINAAALHSVDPANLSARLSFHYQTDLDS